MAQIVLFGDMRSSNRGRFPEKPLLCSDRYFFHLALGRVAGGLYFAAASGRGEKKESKHGGTGRKESELASPHGSIRG